VYLCIPKQNKASNRSGILKNMGTKKGTRFVYLEALLVNKQPRCKTSYLVALRCFKRKQRMFFE
jgi:hypothetical protein